MKIKVVQLKQESAEPEISTSHRVLPRPVLWNLLLTGVILQVAFVPLSHLLRVSHTPQASQRGVLPFLLNSSPRNLTAVKSKPICI